MTKDCFPGAWDSSASGHFDSGEDYDACAVRELREELGLVMTAPPASLQNRRVRRNRAGVLSGFTGCHPKVRLFCTRRKSSAASGSHPPASTS
jgi:predicted NUDIX family NTP pyrophosphohydrolase